MEAVLPHTSKSTNLKRGSSPCRQCRRRLSGPKLSNLSFETSPIGGSRVDLARGLGVFSAALEGNESS